MEITIEQAIKNVQLATEQYRGTKAEHLALEQSMELIKQKVINQSK